MSRLIDTDFTEEERADLLDEVRNHLPAFLQKAATEQHDPAGDVKELLALDSSDLERLVGVHTCLSEEALNFGAALRRGLRSPVTSSIRPPEVSQSVRGPVDWGATIRQRGLRAGDPTVFVVRSAERIYDTPENRALVWLIQELRTRAQQSGYGDPSDPTSEGFVPSDRWTHRISLLSSQLEAASRTVWLGEVRAEAPSARTMRAIQSARTEFYARTLHDAIQMCMRSADPSSEELAELLCERYFEPAESWRLFEVVVALRLARGFQQRLGLRKARLLVGAGASPFARFTLPDGGQIQLFYQRWPPSNAVSRRAAAAGRHGFKVGTSLPDLFIVRTGTSADRVILELKATRSAGYLGEGLSQLLGYIADRPDLWTTEPSGWLVAPNSQAFDCAPPDASDSLWVVDADGVADAAVDRFGI